MLRDNALVELRKKFKASKKERDVLKQTLEKIETSSRNLNVSVPTSSVYDRYKSGEGYHVVPPPYTGTFMPPKPDLVFHDAPTVSETVPNILDVEPRTTKPTKDMSHSNRPSALSLKIGFLTQKMHLRGKQHRASCKTKPVSSVSQPLQRIHMDLFGLTFVKSLNKKSYCLVITDDYSRFSWVFFLATKDETSTILKTFITGIENQINHKVKIIRSNNGTEFKNHDLNQLCGMKGIKREFSVARTHQQNRVVEKNNRTLIEVARTMLAYSLLPIPFWAKAVNTACYVQNRILVTKPHNKTPYELLLGRTPSIGFMRPFRCLVTILNTLNPLGKFDGKADEGFLVGYSISSKAFRVFNRSGPTWLFHIDTLTQSMNYQPVVVGNQPSSSVDPLNTDADAACDDKETESEVHVSPRVRNLNDEFEEFTINNTNGVNVASTPVTAVGPNSTNSTNNFNAASPSDNVVSLNFEIGRKSSFVDPSQYPDDPNMPALEDIVYSDDKEDVGAEADFSNLETSITELCKSFEKLMKDKFQMSSMGEITFFFGLQVKQKDNGIFISQDKYVAKILRKFGLADGKLVSTPIDTEKPLLKDPDAYSDSDYAGASLDRKSTTEGCQFLRCRLISWQCKKHNVVATSSTKAEYIAAASCCAQVLWIQNQLVDYGNRALAIPGQTTTGKESSSPFMADSLPITILLTKSQRFDQIVDFLNAHMIQYALMVNPTIYVSCIKQFWTTVSIKKTNDVVRLQALIDRKKVIIKEDTIRQALQLDDADGVDCLSNEEIFAELARMGYEKPSTKLTFYKAFFSAQWKFLIHTILQCMSAKRTTWNEFSSSMALAVICLATGRNFNFSKYIFDSMIRNVDSSSKFLMSPRFLQLMNNAKVDDLSAHNTKYTSPALTQKVFAIMRRIGKRFSKVDTPLFDGMLVQQVQDVVDVTEEEDDDNEDIDEAEPTEVEEVIEVVTAAKLMTEVVTTVATTITTAQVPKPITPTRRKGVILQDRKETATASVIMHSEVKSKDKGNGILIEEPKPLKR
nr:putative ribonuclease H-like domain-containing protein [Tanacetum cinerariifolium]